MISFRSRVVSGVLFGRIRVLLGPLLELSGISLDHFSNSGNDFCFTFNSYFYFLFHFSFYVAVCEETWSAELPGGSIFMLLGGKLGMGIADTLWCLKLLPPKRGKKHVHFRKASHRIQTRRRANEVIVVVVVVVVVVGVVIGVVVECYCFLINIIVVVV